MRRIVLIRQIATRRGGTTGFRKRSGGYGGPATAPIRTRTPQQMKPTTDKSYGNHRAERGCRLDASRLTSPYRPKRATLDVAAEALRAHNP
jgi:hypothetical protein